MKDQRKKSAPSRAVGAVSPPGGDISEPVSQATLRIVKVFWGLDAYLAYRRHFPSINWLNSYSLYLERLTGWYEQNISKQWPKLRTTCMLILQQEAELEEIVKLVGIDALSASDRLALEAARSIREDYLQQNAFDEIDTYTSMKKQFGLLKLVLKYYDRAKEALNAGAGIEAVTDAEVRVRIGKAKQVPEQDFERVFEDIAAEIDKEMEQLSEEVR